MPSNKKSCDGKIIEYTRKINIKITAWSGNQIKLGENRILGFTLSHAEFGTIRSFQSEKGYL